MDTKLLTEDMYDKIATMDDILELKASCDEVIFREKVKNAIVLIDPKTFAPAVIIDRVLYYIEAALDAKDVAKAKENKAYSDAMKTIHD